MPTPVGIEVTRLADALLVVLEPDGTVRARHALLNEAVLRELAGTDRASVHRRVAQVLAGTHGDGLAAEIAGHWREAGDRIEELRWGEKAADHAWTIGAYLEA